MIRAKDYLKERGYKNRIIDSGIGDAVEVDRVRISDIMEEYAMQESIAFANWTMINFENHGACFSATPKDNKAHMLYLASRPDMGIKKKIYTDQEVYKLWKDENSRKGIVGHV
jgi:hypothetical protein